MNDINRLKNILWDMSDILNGKGKNKVEDLIDWCFELKDVEAINMRELKQFVIMIHNDNTRAFTHELERLHMRYDIPFLD